MNTPKKFQKNTICVALSLLAALIFLSPLRAVERVESLDQNGDGKKETQKFYSDKDTLLRSAKDTNDDGKPDLFIKYVKGRNVILREYDRNGDGKVDKRKLQEWGTRRLVPGQEPIPSYVTLMMEEDNDHDGKTDTYTEKGNKNAAKDKIGRPFDTRISA